MKRRILFGILGFAIGNLLGRSVRRSSTVHPSYVARGRFLMYKDPGGPLVMSYKELDPEPLKPSGNLSVHHNSEFDRKIFGI